MNEQVTKKVYIAWVNSDTTEGRGRDYPLAVCAMESTARRLGQGQNVQGSDARITEHMLPVVAGWVQAPTRIIEPTRDDKAAQTRIDAHNEAIRYAKSRGVTDDMIEDIKRGVLR